ncbi:hypothetical protein [Fannyhessea vaginae]|uniref:hypothetical protein n=1 Tax=Fannyhessea vaginae TaxID=82135 RepID=UPI0023F028CF|nr:hypothetical protein [Fannyhessea vaginae]
MKNNKTIANILWALGVFSLLLVILEESNITHFLPIYFDFYEPTTTEQINLSNTLTLSICCIGYLLLGISLVLKIVTATSTKKSSQTNKPIIKIILISLKVVAVIFTLLIIAFSLLLVFFSFLVLVVDFNTPQ